MKRVFAILLTCGVVLAGCSSNATTATEEDQAAIKKLATEGIGTGPGGGAPAQNTPPPVNGEVSNP